MQESVKMCDGGEVRIATDELVLLLTEYLGLRFGIPPIRTLKHLLLLVNAMDVKNNMTIFYGIHILTPQIIHSTTNMLSMSLICKAYTLLKPMFTDLI